MSGELWTLNGSIGVLEDVSLRLMLIDIRFVYHSVYPDLGVEIFFEKERTAENRVRGHWF